MNGLLRFSFRRKNQLTSKCFQKDSEMEPPNLDTEESRKEKMALLQKWASDNVLIPELTEKDFWMFLQSCECDLESAKNTMVSYYKLRIQSPEFFSNRDPSAKELMVASMNGYAFPLSGETKEGYKVFMCGYLHSDTSTFVHNDTMKRCLMAIDLWLSKMESCPGMIVMIDCKNCSFGHITATPLEASKKMVNYFQEALPVRLQAVYFINISPAMNFLLSILQPFLSKRITSLIHKSVRGSEEFFSAIPKEILPTDVGGEAGTVQQMNDAVTQDLIDNAEWFREEDIKIRQLATKNRQNSKTDEFD